MQIQNILSYIENSNFWSGFWANLLSDLIIATFVTVVISLLLKSKEKNDEHREKIRQDEMKAIKYLQSIKMEVEDIDIRVNMYLSRHDFYKYIHLYTNFWDSLQFGGEIPTLFHPVLFESLSIYYSHANEVNTLYRILVDMTLLKTDYIRPDIEKKLQENLNSLLNINYKDNLIIMINQCIQQSQIKIEQTSGKRVKPKENNITRGRN
jgi:hypothetical protein